MTTVVGSDRHLLSTLAAWEASPLVSTFFPVDFAQPQPQQALARALKHAAQVASARLVAEHGLDSTAAAAFVAPMTDLALRDAVPQSALGLAVFASSARIEHVALPLAVGPAVEIGDQIDLLRMLPAYADDVAFFALTIDQKGAHLYQGGKFEFERLSIPQMPGPLDDELWYIRREPILNRHGSGVIHGAGGGEDLRKDDVRQYLRLVDKAIAPRLSGSGDPLIVVGVEYEAAMFVNHTRYRAVVDSPVLGSPDTLPLDEIHRRCWERAWSAARPDRAALERLGEFVGTGRAPIDPAEVLAACRLGAAGELLVARSATDGGERAPMSDGQRRAIVAAVNEGLRREARIHVVDDETLPDGALVAALLRF